MNQARFPSFKALSDAAVQYVQQHPKSLSAILGTVLLTSGATAFAVAELGPDPSNIPVHEILEAVTPQSETLPPLSAADALPFTLYRTETVRSNDSVDSLLARLGVADSAAAAFLRSDRAARQQILGQAGRNVQAETDDRNQLTRLTVRYVDDDSGNFKRLVISQASSQSGQARAFQSQTETAPLVATERLGSGTLDTTLFAAIESARLPNEMAGQLADIFSGKFDFRDDLKKGDRFSVVYEAMEADGEPISTGRILSAEFTNQGKTYNALWFQAAPDGKGAYYAFNGDSLRSSYLNSPLTFSHITSVFSARFHPILKRWKAHTGVDFAAPMGTPIHTVGDGVVEFAGVQTGYGNVVFIRHSPEHVTVYAHMSRIDVQTGDKVSQNDVIGRVGVSGWATGPHVHFELRVNGEFKDPQTIAQYSVDSKLPASARAAFNRKVAEARINLGAAPLVQTASAL